MLLRWRSGLGEGGGGNSAAGGGVDDAVMHGMLRPCQVLGQVHTTRYSMVTAACGVGSSPRLYVRKQAWRG